MALHDDVLTLRNQRLAAGQPPVPEAIQGVTRAKVAEVLGVVALGGNADIVDGVYALLDDETPSWFAKPPAGAKVADGATTAHLACHIGILQRGNGKADREGRDYWIKPLRELGGFVPITLLDGAFIVGHVKSKSPNSCYRLDEELVAILKAPDPEWRNLLAVWASADPARGRKAFQAEMEEASRKLVDSGHADLIRASVDHYAARFLPGYQLLYIDDSDGDRVSPVERAKMAAAGVTLTLEDAMPDAQLWHPEADHLWVIEAVTSDGEVDFLRRDNQDERSAPTRPTARWVWRSGVIAVGWGMRVLSLFRRSARARPPCDRSSDEALHEAPIDRPHACRRRPRRVQHRTRLPHGAGSETAVGEAHAA